MAKIHPLADVQSEHIGINTRIWQFCVILPGAEIGDNCNICANVLIENKVKIGNNCTIKSGVQLWDGVTLEDNVCIGPNVTFTNDITPRSKNKDYNMLNTLVKRGASICANATIVPGHCLGEYCLIGAGSVVTKDVPPYTVWYGNPAKQKGFVTKKGIVLDMEHKDKRGNIIMDLENN